MAQAKTLTPTEIEQLLSHINTRKYAARNRSMMLLTHDGQVALIQCPRCRRQLKGLKELVASYATSVGPFVATNDGFNFKSKVTTQMKFIGCIQCVVFEHE